ncbi:MAG TPA: acetate--CoA ligase family protein [Burkholderiales bacterium]|jgi:acyl-CoA synthetase (NDP forming)|nr:acetate--CoA ligase family protein [Burkholderiales bacterium]
MTSSDKLRAALDPKSVAIVGASDNENKIGGRPLLYLRKQGFRGRLYPINPNRKEVQGLKAYPDLWAVPQTPEVAIIAVADEAAVDAVETCAQAGVSVAIVMSSGFGETGTPDGKAKEARMREAARAAGMRLIGPNTQGLANFGTSAILSFSTMFIELPPQDGPIAIVSQSGAMSVVPYGLLRARGLGVRHAHATGNDAEVSAGELAALVAEDSEVKLLLLYLESVADSAPLVRLAHVARSRSLPVVALKAGRTAAGQEAARSHTGALANEDRIVDAFLERHGIWRAQNTQDLVRAAEVYLKGWRPRGKKVVVISNSGAVCVMGADAATQTGLQIAALSDDTRAQLKKILPGFATVANPIDITAALLTNSRLFSDILPVVAKDPSADAVVIGIPVAGQGYDIDAFARDTGAFARETGKPVVAAITQASIARRFREEKVPVFETEAEAIAALAQFLNHAELMRNAPRADSAPAHRTLPAASIMLDEAQSLALAGRFGIPVVEHRLCATAQQALHAFARLGAPVAVKGCSRDVVHKSEMGLVHLGLTNQKGVRRAFEAVRHALLQRGCAFDGVIVARMARGRRELMVGARRDPAFGPVVIVGDGGKYVEVMPDARVLLWPFDEEAVLRALTRLRIAPLFAGVRGEPALDAAAVVQVVMAAGRLIADPAVGVASMDLNPLIVGAQGEGCRVADAVVYVDERRRREAGGGQ